MENTSGARESNKSIGRQNGGPYSCTTTHISSVNNSAVQTLIKYEIDDSLTIKEEIAPEIQHRGKHNLLSGKNELEEKYITTETSSGNNFGATTLIAHDYDETLEIKEEIIQENNDSTSLTTDNDGDNNNNNDDDDDDDDDDDHYRHRQNSIACSQNNKESGNTPVHNKEERMSICDNDTENIKEKTGNEKKAWCPFCSKDVSSNNFVRHFERFHRDEKEIKSILQLPTKSKERREAFELFRKQINFDLYIHGTVRPYRQTTEPILQKFYPCIYCRGMFKKSYVTRHSKLCREKASGTDGLIQENHRSYMSDSQTLAACAIDPTNVISRLNVKQQVFNIMKPDDISFVAKQDLLIVQFGECYLKKHTRERTEYSCSQRMRELSRLLIAYREIVHVDTVSLKDILKPRNVDNVFAATRKISGYDPLRKTFKAPSLAMHLGTYLKDICRLLVSLILKESSGFRTKSQEESQLWIQDVKNCERLIESSWNTEISGVANKDLEKKRWNKPLLVPLVSDIRKFKDEALKLATECEEKFLHCLDDIATYKTFVHCILALLILFNRRRIGDVQYLKIEDYKMEFRSNFPDFKNALTESENILTKKYKRVMSGSKGSRAVVILVPQLLQKFIKILLEERKKYVSVENVYVFAIPNSETKWGQGDVAIRFLTQRIQLQYPQAISSHKLRKQIATVAQILNMSKEERKQFSQFMGHSEKAHAEFYELPVDIYQTAKVSKLLLMMDRGTLPVEHQGKSLAEIDFDENLEYAEECNEDRVEETLGPYTSQAHTFSNANNCSEDLDTNLDPTESPVSRKDKIIKIGWSSKEIELVNKQFKEFIERGSYPSSKDMTAFIKETEIHRSVSQIRSKIQHLIRINKTHQPRNICNLRSHVCMSNLYNP